MFRLAAPHLFVDNLCVGAKRLRQGDGFTFAWVKFRQRRVWRYGDLPYLQPFWRAYDPSSHGSRAKSRRNARDEDPFIAKIHAGQNLFRC